MMKKIWTSAALAAFLAFPAFAQDAAPSRMKNEPPAPQEQRANVESKGAAMTAGQISASELLDETVMNEANESIGDVNDVLLDTSGKIASVIVGVGGFLGMGEKDVALSFENLKFAKDKDNDLVVTTNVTKETLQATPAYTKPNQ
jgi:sporulation protein YlmC with PRC-barrel domain